MRRVNGKTGRAGNRASVRNRVGQSFRHATESALSRAGAPETIWKKKAATTQNVVGIMLIFSFATNL